MRKFLTLLFCLLLAVVPFTALAEGEAIENLSPTTEFYVSDYADVVEPDDASAIIALNKRLRDDTGAQIAVVTVESLDGLEIRDAGHKLFQRWKPGEADKDNGVLILFSMGDRLYSIEIGKGLEGAIPDITSGHIQDDVMTPYFKDGDYSGGMLAGCKKLAALIYQEYGKEMPEDLAGELDELNSISYSDEGEMTGEDVGAVSVFMIIVLLIIIIAIFRSGKGGRGGHSGGGYYGGGGFGGGGFSGGGGSFGGGGSHGGGGSSRGF